MHDLSYQYFGLDYIRRLHASPPEAEPLSAWVGYIALARLSAGGGTVVRLGGVYKALALIRRLRQPAHPFGARRSASVQKPYKPSGFFLLAFGNTVARWGACVDSQAPPSCSPLWGTSLRFFFGALVGLRAEKV